MLQIGDLIDKLYDTHCPDGQHMVNGKCQTIETWDEADLVPPITAHGYRVPKIKKIKNYKL